MRTVITITKITQRDLEILKSALNNYASSLQMLQEIMPEPRRFKIDLSITVELWYEFNLKTASQYPPEKTRLKLFMHKALILIDALYEMMKITGTTDYEKNRCNRFIMALDEQMPTNTQLLTKITK